tara:strand:- start:141 stop:674 length:534 start_codon:yes stop_codon:yes gene_type:complete
MPSAFVFTASTDDQCAQDDDLETIKTSIGQIKVSHERLMQAVQRIETKLRAQTNELEASKTKFVETKVAIEGALERFKGRVKLNVGGVKYETTLTTLTADGDDSMLGSMFSGRHELHPNDEGEIFIDRDGRLFGHILNLLRDTNVEVPVRDRTALHAELKYHGISEARRKRLLQIVP